MMENALLINKIPLTVRSQSLANTQINRGSRGPRVHTTEPQEQTMFCCLRWPLNLLIIPESFTGDPAQSHTAAIQPTECYCTSFRIQTSHVDYYVSNPRIMRLAIYLSLP